MSRRPRIALRLLAWLFVLLPLLALAGCRLEDYPQSTIHPRSDYAQMIQDLLEQQVLWVVIIFVLVQGLLLVAALRFRARPGMPDPKPVHGNTVLEIAWTIAPAIVLALIAVPTVLTIYRTQGPRPPDSILIKAIGHQWWWEFQYPDFGITTSTEMAVPVGVTAYVEIETADVLHSFWFPAMGGKRDAVPNRTNVVFFKPDSTGTFLGQCAELCGTHHANMKMKLFVKTREEFDAWVAHQKSPPAMPDSGTLAFAGRRYYAESGCIACHTVSGVSAGVIGPNLDHVGSRTMIAGGIMPLTSDHLQKWIAEPDKMKPGTLMLNLGLPPEQVQAITAYLMSLK